jgi:hypothetical protein
MMIAALFASSRVALGRPRPSAAGMVDGSAAVARTRKLNEVTTGPGFPALSSLGSASPVGLWYSSDRRLRSRQVAADHK